MALKGIDPGFDRLILALRSVGSGASRAELSRKLGMKMIWLVQDGLARGIDPYGRSYPPRRSGGLPLQGIADSMEASFDERGPRIKVGKWYAKVHQAGMVIRAVSSPVLRFMTPVGWRSAKQVTIPQRIIVPTRRYGGLGPIWGPALMKMASEFLMKRLRKR